MHTHAAYDPTYENDIFSKADKFAARRLGHPAYLVTPLGILRKYDPTGEKDILLYDDLPFDPNHPGRK